MPRVFPATLIAAFLFTPSLVWAEPMRQDREGFTPTINLTMEQKHIIKELVQELRVDGAADNLEVSVGAAVPKTVQLHPMPAHLSEKISQIKNHLFFLKGGKIVIVEPTEGKAVDIID